jgi:hypothetical protein
MGAWIQVLLSLIGFSWATKMTTDFVLLVYILYMIRFCCGFLRHCILKTGQEWLKLALCYVQHASGLLGAHHLFYIVWPMISQLTPWIRTDILVIILTVWSHPNCIGFSNIVLSLVLFMQKKQRGWAMHARDFSSFVIISVKQKLPTPLSGSCLPFAQHVLYCYIVKVLDLSIITVMWRWVVYVQLLLRMFLYSLMWRCCFLCYAVRSAHWHFWIWRMRAWRWTMSVSQCYPIG